ncbi:AAA family ATPase [Chitinimonas sp. PSY-7]|uniref:AAA family ATPase n=1 Tax=Chitinimonas sp. PSY-7 TaxID=3459088 RepID=UPI00403FD3BD
MYLEHFGLAEPPFRITPHTEFFYQGAERGATLEALQYAILHGEGLVKVTGEVGAGKTMLCRVLMERLPANIELAYLANPSLSRDEILLTIADELKLDLAHAHNRIPIRALQNALIARYAAGRQVVILIDEAHAMPVESLEEIRLLSNLEHGHHKLMQIVLFGQPELDAKLAEQHMRQLRERITHSFQLAPLRQKDVGEYLMFRMRTAGYRGPDIFTSQAEKLIATESEGLTRRINILADKALISAFSAGQHQVGTSEARAAIKDSKFRQRSRKLWHRPAMTFSILLLGLLTGAAGAHWLTLPNQPIKSTFVKLKPLQAHTPAIKPEATPQTAVSIPTSQPEPAVNKPEPTPPVQAAPVNPQAPESLFQMRLEESRNVMSRQSAEHYTVLLSAAPRDARKELANFLAQAARKLPIDALYLYPTSNRNGVPYYGLSYGVFADRTSAAHALATLPEELRRDHPLLRSIGGIRSEMWRE